MKLLPTYAGIEQTGDRTVDGGTWRLTVGEGGYRSAEGGGNESFLRGCHRI